MDKDVTGLPRSAMVALACVAVAAFAVSMLVPALSPGKDSLLGVPLAVVALVWAIPLMLALLRGEPWAFVVGLALLMFITDASFRSRPWNDKSVDAQVLARALIWVGCGFVGLVRLSHSSWLLKRPPTLFAMAFLALLTLSAAWSPLPLYTLQSTVAYTCMFLFGVAAAEIIDEKQLLVAIALGSGMIVIPSLGIAPFAVGLAPPSPGSTGEADRLRGLTDHPIPMAEVSALFTFAVAALMVKARGMGARMGLFVLVLCGTLAALLTQSRIPPLGMVASALAFFAYRKGGWLLMVPSLILCLGLAFLMESVGGFAAMLPQDLLAMASRSGHSSEILTLSGRLDIWPYVTARIMDSPLLGHGHASGMEVFKGFTRWKITHAHNMYLQALLYVGLPGFLLMMGIFFCQLRLFVTRPSPVRDILLLYVMLKGFTEQSVLSNMPAGAVAAWFVTVGMAAAVWNRRPAPARSAGNAVGKAPASPASTMLSRGSAAR